MPRVSAASSSRPGLAFRFLQRCLRRFFRTFYLLEVHGVENIPATGPVIIAANHVNPFDAIILGACAPRQVRFIVWNRTFNQPAFRWIMNSVGCIPINRDRPDTVAFKESLRWLSAGNILGIFPEGRYTETGHLHELKPGTMRIALAANAAVVPATLTGAYKAWPLRGANAKAFPKPWKISIKFHPAIPPRSPRAATTDSEPVAAVADRGTSITNQRTAAVELTEQLAAAISSTLEPAIRAEEKIARLLEQPAPPLRIYEWFLPIVLLLTRQWPCALIAGTYFLYLLADVYLIRQSAITRALRNFSPALALLAAYPFLLEVIGLPAGGWWIAAYVVILFYAVWMLVTYCYNHYRQFQRLVRGLLLTFYLSLLGLILIPGLPRPSLAITVAVFLLAFDFAHDRRRFYPACLITPAALLPAVVAHGYPLAWLPASAGMVAAVFAYMHLLKFRAHDGRRI